MQSNADKAKAWAATLGIPVSHIGLMWAATSVFLRADTRATNHGFDNGAATAVQSVLEAGSAVLVDHFGVPRSSAIAATRCSSPTPVKSDPTYNGPRWPGFEPTPSK